jgi:hypothetical protein
VAGRSLDLRQHLSDRAVFCGRISREYCVSKLINQKENGPIERSRKHEKEKLSKGFPSATGPRRPTRKMIGKSFSRKTSSAQWSPAKWRGWNIFNA